MKSLILILGLLIFPFNTNQAAQPFLIDYIEIKHTGMEDYPSRTMLISKEKLNVVIEKQWLAGRLSDSVSDKQKNAILNFHYQQLVTDSNTFAMMARFIKQNKKYSTDSKRINSGGWNDYSITLNGKRYDIYGETSLTYFREFLKYLESNKCDQRIIDAKFHI